MNKTDERMAAFLGKVIGDTVNTKEELEEVKHKLLNEPDYGDVLYEAVKKSTGYAEEDKEKEKILNEIKPEPLFEEVQDPIVIPDGPKIETSLPKEDLEMLAAATAPFVAPSVAEAIVKNNAEQDAEAFPLGDDTIVIDDEMVAEAMNIKDEEIEKESKVKRFFMKILGR